MAIHAIGDRANSEALHALESLARIRTNQNLPRLSHRIEHVQCLQPQDLGRLGELGVTASMQPIHATSDMLMADQFWGERVRTSYAWRSLLDRNTSLLFGSDAPVESPNPFFGIHAAVTRRRADGKPGREGWVPEERISLSEAFAAYIAGGTRLRGDRVRLASGTAADLIVLSSDPFEIDMDAVRSLLPSGTMVAGKWRQREF
jgi:predicted amidohydrolase YtcJ